MFEVRADPKNLDFVGWWRIIYGSQKRQLYKTTVEKDNWEHLIHLLFNSCFCLSFHPPLWNSTVLSWSMWLSLGFQCMPLPPCSHASRPHDHGRQWDSNARHCYHARMPLTKSFHSKSSLLSLSLSGLCIIRETS